MIRYATQHFAGDQIVHVDIGLMQPQTLKRRWRDLEFRKVFEHELGSGLHIIERVPGGYIGGADPRRDGIALGD